MSSNALSSRRHLEKHTNGTADSQVLASAAGGGRLAVVTKGKKHRQTLHLYMLQVCLCVILEVTVAAVDQLRPYRWACIGNGEGRRTDVLMLGAFMYSDLVSLHTLQRSSAAG